jgi:hypothetical protein
MSLPSTQTWYTFPVPKTLDCYRRLETAFLPRFTNTVIVIDQHNLSCRSQCRVRPSARPVERPTQTTLCPCQTSAVRSLLNKHPSRREGRPEKGSHQCLDTLLLVFQEQIMHIVDYQTHQ